MRLNGQKTTVYRPLLTLMWTRLEFQDVDEFVLAHTRHSAIVGSMDQRRKKMEQH